LKIYEKAVSDVLWLFFPGTILMLVLIAIGEGGALKGSPEVALISAVAFGQSITSFRNVERPDIWAYNLLAIVLFAGALVLAILLSISKYSDKELLINGFPLLWTNFICVILSIIFLSTSKVFEEKYNKFKNENVSKADTDAA